MAALAANRQSAVLEASPSRRRTASSIVCNSFAMRTPPIARNAYLCAVLDASIDGELISKANWNLLLDEILLPGDETPRWFRGPAQNSVP
ncbi:hypothetical protein [Mesorhizobium sp. M0244]|uniref:hypothetical protein n=1 Tax=Mesorhizobium sp. M0244 TaxID=2956926 RepID=UPI003337119B